MTLVAVTRHLPEPGVSPLLDAGLHVAHRDIDAPAGFDELVALGGEASALFTLLTERVDGDVLDACPGVRVVANMAVGYDNIDVDAATERGVQVTNTPDVLTEATADLAWALLLAGARRLGEGERLVRTGTWTGWRPTELLGRRVGGATLGIFGMGKIGAAVAQRATGFGMEILYTNRRPSPAVEAATGARFVTFEELITRADFLSINAPLTDETRHRFGAPEFAAMKPSAIVVNTARGPLIDEAALVEAVRSGRIGGAALDVFEREPALEQGLAELDAVVLAPHLGSATVDARAAMVDLACRNIIEVLAGRGPVTPVNTIPTGGSR